MTEFTFGRFSDRRNLAVPEVGVTVDVFGADSDLGLDDSVELGPDDAPVLSLQFRIATGGRGRVFEVTE